MSGSKSIILTVMIGAVLGAVFMFAVLGYFRGSPLTDTGELTGTDSARYVEDSADDSAFPSTDLDIASDEISLSRRNAIVRAAEKIGPAVVSLSVLQVVQWRESSPLGNKLWDLLNLLPPIVEKPVLSLGSGVIINPDGYVLTNHHVVEGAKEIRVTLTNGDEYPGILVGSDPVTDLAVVKIHPDSAIAFPNAVLGDSDDLIIGEWAIAVGNPFGYLLDDSKPTVTVGVISGTDRDIKTDTSQQAIYRKMIQTDAAINPGNSGGPLVNALGEVIGINSFIFTLSRGSEGVGFAVPINRAKVVISDILKFGEVVKAWIGLEVGSITPEIAHSLELRRTRGLVISSVSENSPAAKAGLKPGDVPVSVSNSEISSEADWDEIESYARAGQALGAKVLRGDKELSLVIVPEEVPTRLARRKTDKFGLEVAEITPSVASYIGVINREGVLVMGASETSWAARWKLRPGDIIRQVGRHVVKNLDDYVRTMENIGKGYKIVFLVESGGGIYFVTART